MKILSEKEYYDFHPALGFICLVCGLLLLCAVVAFIVEAFKEGRFDLFLASMVLVIFSLMLFQGFNESLDHKMVYEYKAIITDFNEVHDKGYEIVDREGEIYTLVKTKK
ncbi:hypothetical protein [Exiguobacterium sp. s133]|uniref:hypothetical protein n=1 Tax=Exiguobacterium sp. s133 TaxID=2751213 RepID=UPI001BE64E9B|nr:hypothetical protein [Exiguobacterium sp. s133]